MGHSFALVDKKKQKKFFNFKKLWLVLIIILLILLVLWGISKLSNYFGFVEKVRYDKDYVYTVKKVENLTQEETYDKIPEINIVGDTVKEVNKTILENYQDIKKHGEYDYQYEFSRSANILSLKITYAYYLDNNAKEVTRFFETYNINLKTGELISDKELLNIYKITPKQLNDYLELKFKNYYKELINYGYFTSKVCDYNCFLANRGITSNYTDDIYLYVDKGSLVIFKFYYKVSKYEEESYFDDISYKIVIKRK